MAMNCILPRFSYSASLKSAFLQQKLRDIPLRHLLQRRAQSTTSNVTAEVGSQSALVKYWHSPVGPKTVHFWAPIMKWGVVLAGVSDFAKPASALSLNQNCALMATGAIWTRWCFIIKPRNIFLATVNFFLFCVGATQTGRVLLYRRSVDGQSTGEEMRQMGQDAKNSAKEIAAKADDALDKAKRT